LNGGAGDRGTRPPAGAGPDAAGAVAERALRQAPDPREMALIAGLAFFLNLFPGSLLQIADLRWGLLATQTLLIAAPVLLALRWFYLEPRAVLSLRRPAPAAWAAAVLGVAGLNRLLTVAGAWQESVFPMPEPMRLFYDALLAYRGPLDFAWLLLAFAVVPAVCEEILFRGFLQAGFVRLFESAPRGIAATALVFAVFHLDPWRFAGILVLGLFLGALAQRTGSLWPAVAAHALNNTLSIAGSAFGREEGTAGFPAWRDAAAALAIAAALGILGRRRAAAGRAAERVL
jgi:membrane protease YdiL (CAAX protease family)